VPTSRTIIAQETPVERNLPKNNWTKDDGAGRISFHLKPVLKAVKGNQFKASLAGPN